MAKLGPKEQQLRDLKALPRHHQMMLEDGAPIECLRTGPGPKPPKPRDAVDPGVSLALPWSVQKAILADLADDDETQPATPAPTPKETAMSKKTTTKKASKAKARTPVKEKTSGVRPGSKLEIVVGLLTRAEGCTAKEVLDACHWPSVSMPQQAKAAGLTLKKEKVKGEPTRYRAA